MVKVMTDLLGIILHLDTFTSLPNKKILDRSKRKAFADENVNMAENLKFCLGSVENIVGKGENAGYQHFLFSLNVFKRLLF